MSRPVSVSEFKTHCLRIVEEVAKGRREVVITRRGKRVARLVPVEDEAPAGHEGRPRRLESFDALPIVSQMEI